MSTSSTALDAHLPVVARFALLAVKADGRGSIDERVKLLSALGMIPIAPTVFWGPMAYAIMGGSLVATVLALIFLPALYVACFRVKEPAAAA